MLITSACAGVDRSAPAGVQTVRVTERDFRITVRPVRLHAGLVQLSVHNKGPIAHELVLLRESGSRLPLRTDGITVDEDAIEPATLGVLEPAQAGATRTLRVRLSPGRYELICNMYGHYLGGMRARLLVT